MKRTVLPVTGINAATQTALDTKTPLITQLPASGQYFFPLSQQSATTSNTLGNGNMRVAPWRLTQPVTISRIGGEITVIGDSGCKLRPVIYADNGSAYPGALILDGGQLSADAVASPEATVNQLLTAGIIWLGGVVQAVTTTQPTVRVMAVDQDPGVLMPLGTSAPSAGATLIGFSTGAGVVTGAAPSTFPTGGFASGSAPRLFVKRA